MNDVPTPTPTPEGQQLCSVCGLFWRHHPANPTVDDCVNLMAKNGQDPAKARALILADAKIKKSYR